MEEIMSLINHINSFILTEKRFLNKIRYNKMGYYIHSRNKIQNFKVSVIMPVYNAENTIKKTIDSIARQSIGFDNIELLIIDDKSDDKSRSIILKYAKENANIIPVFLKDNSGSPSIPRNLGIDLAKGKYTIFIDSDDWLHENGVQVLYDLLEKTNDNYAVGKTIKVDDKGQYIVGEYNSWIERKSINPFSIKHLFNHLGPTARMMNTEMLKINNIKFPNMKFAEDKHFFIDVLTTCGTISTTDKIIYYANRYSDNKGLTTTTTIFEKTDTNIALINYVINKNLPTDIEKMALNRLYEFDCITRLFDRYHFLRSKKKEEYYKKFAEVLSTAENLSYDFTENFFHPWHKVLVELFREERFDDIVSLIKWHNNDITKDYFIEENTPYYKLPFLDKNKTRINMIAIHHQTIKQNDKLTVQFKIYGDHIENINSLVVRQRNNDLTDIEFPIRNKEDNLFESDLPYELLDDLSSASHAVYIKYLDYMKVAIRMNARNIISHKKRKLDFYTTISDNFGLNIK